jgi:hypothetical protein
MTVPAETTTVPAEAPKSETPGAIEALPDAKVPPVADAKVDTLAQEAVAGALAEGPLPAAGQPEPAKKRPPLWRQGRVKPGTSLIAVTAISFSLTFVGVSLALLAGVLPPSFASLQPPVDLGVVLLMVPLFALVFAMMAEALRAALKGTPRPHVHRAVVALNTWQPGRGEG